MTQLPVTAVLPAIKESLRRHANLVLTAPPGAGKTTVVPPALLDEPWLRGRRILMLQPRRLAARMSARYLAAMRGETVGGVVGFRVRRQTQIGPQTRLEILTEGILIRILQNDPALTDVGLVIFDEFHERSLQADLGLALCLQTQAILREDLRIMVMSATLDAAPVAALLGDAPVIAAEGRSFPVETRYPDRRAEGPVEAAVADTVLQSLGATGTGDILVFLPGAGEIRRVKARLDAVLDPSGVKILPLHGTLPARDQDLALKPGPAGERKIVLATSIAQTSLTVEGITTVIDSGLARVPRYSPRTGMTRLETAPVSLAAADQRRGRAGRLGPGLCYRLWTRRDEAHMMPQDKPEILESDLAALALELAAWGADPAELRWLDRPPEAAYSQAVGLLEQLGALQGGKITPHGRLLAQAGTHPRLAHMIAGARTLGLGGLACDLAALLGERDTFAGGGRRDVDIRLRLDAFRDPCAPRSVWRQAAQEASHLRRIFAIASADNAATGACGLLLALAYPDRIARRRDSGHFLLRGGRGAALPPSDQSLAGEPYLAVADLDDRGANALIHLAAPLDESDIYKHLADQIVEEKSITWDREAQAVKAVKTDKLGAIVLREGPLSGPDPEEVLAALIAGIAREGLAILPWTRAAVQLRRRIMMLHWLDAAWPDLADETLVSALAGWLGPHIWGMSRRQDLEKLNLAAIIENMLDWDQRRRLDDLAPTHITVPSGQRIPIDYSDPAAPILAVRLQELFGMRDTPLLAAGRVAVTVHLLSPARRPVQVTRDLASFWRTGYFDVRKDLAGRYPKHYWPEDPLTATATHRVRPKP